MYLKEIASQYGVSPMTLYRWLKKAKIDLTITIPYTTANKPFIIRRYHLSAEQIKTIYNRIGTPASLSNDNYEN